MGFSYNVRFLGMETNIIYNEDCLVGMKRLPNKSVGLAILDPPYGSGGRDGSVHLNNANLYGNRVTSDSLIWMTRQYGKILFDKTKQDSHCYVFSDWRKYKDIQIAFETSGWELRSLIIWNKGNGMGEFWRSCHEFILFFAKIKPRKLNHGSCFNVLHYKTQRNKLHPAQKPLDLISFLIEASSNKGEIILDPFMGSGTTAIACKRLNRKYIGYEIEKKYYDIAIKRLEAEKTLRD